MFNADAKNAPREWIENKWIKPCAVGSGSQESLILVRLPFYKSFADCSFKRHLKSKPITTIITPNHFTNFSQRPNEAVERTPSRYSYIKHVRTKD